MPLTYSRDSSVSIIRAISNKNPHFLWQVVELNYETNFLNFHTYMQIEQFFRDPRRTVVIIDNAT